MCTVNGFERDYLDILMDQSYCEEVSQEEYIEQLHNSNTDKDKQKDH